MMRPIEITNRGLILAFPTRRMQNEHVLPRGTSTPQKKLALRPALGSFELMKLAYSAASPVSAGFSSPPSKVGF